MAGISNGVYTRQVLSASPPQCNLLLLLLCTNLISILLTIHLRPSPPLAGGADITSGSLAGNRDSIASLRRELDAVTSLAAALSSTFSSPPAPAPESEMSLLRRPHSLPFGYTPNLDADKLFMPLGDACAAAPPGHRVHDALKTYMTYTVGGDCPDDGELAQWLLLQGCEPLPRRRCHSRGPPSFPDPSPFPASLWTLPPDSSTTWLAGYDCKNYSCLADRENHPGSYDCKDCFNLAGRESHRWVTSHGDLDFTIDSVLSAKPPGTVRVGLDIGGGTGTFAARMAERGVTVVTTTLNLGAPFGPFIASRGLVPIHVGAIAGRLPFFDGTLDIVHSMHVLSNWIPSEVLQRTLFDIFRVLRPGGIFWLDHFFCVGSELNGTYVPLIAGVRFRELRWHVGRKLDRGPDADEWYISALLERPTANHK